MNDKLGTPIECGSIISNMSSEYQIAIVVKVHRDTLEVIQYDNSERYFYPNSSWGNHVKVIGHIGDELDMDKLRKSGSEIRRAYIDNRRNELQEELKYLNEIAVDIFYDGQ